MKLSRTSFVFLTLSLTFFLSSARFFFFSPCVGDGLMIFGECSHCRLGGGLRCKDRHAGRHSVDGRGWGWFHLRDGGSWFWTDLCNRLGSASAWWFFGLVTTFYSSFFLNGINNIYNLFVVANNIARHRQSMTIH
ncbi:hypothetical protein ACFS07_12935 [Undibacterium arcticum]